MELRPDPALGEAIEATEQQRLQGVRGGMGESDLEAVVASTQELKHRQETPDTPEALACIPSLQLSGEGGWALLLLTSRTYGWLACIAAVVGWPPWPAA